MSTTRRRTMAPHFRFSALTTLAVLSHLLAGPPAGAQYLFLDVNGNGAHDAGDVIAPSGSTTLTIWLRTDQNRDGSAALCAGGEPMTLGGYQVVLRVGNGTVIWGPLANGRSEFTSSYGTVSDATELAGGHSGAPLPPGLYPLATVAVEPAIGTPSISVVAQSRLASSLATSFVSTCPGADMDNTMKLGTDWFDTDGAEYGGAANRAPVLAPLSPMSVGEGTAADQPLSATDADGDGITLALVSGPGWVTVTDTTSGPGAASGLVHVAPGFEDAGTATVTVEARDALASTRQSFALTVRDVNRAPLFIQPDDMMVGEGEILERPLTADDPDGERATFALRSGPGYVSVTTLVSELGHSTGSVRVAPGYTDAGMAHVAIAASDGALEAVREFSVMVREQDRPPVLSAPSSCSGAEGEPLTFVASAADPDGEMVELDAAPLPPGASFTDRMDNTGVFHWTPGYDQAGATMVTVTADDHAGAVVSANVAITVADVASPVALAQPDSVALYEGETREQALHAFDEDGGALAFTLAAGPSWATVETVDPGAGLATGRLRVAPGFGDACAAALVIAASDGVNRAERTVPVTVLDAGSAPGETPFTPPFLTLGTGLTPHTVTIADVDQDGRPDLGVANLGANSVSIYRGRGDGTFEMRMDYPTAARPHTLVIRDLNGDAVPDLAVTQIAASSIAAFLGRGDGTFGARADFAMPGSPVFLGVADFNEDGRPDVAATDQTNGAVTEFRGAGDGTFAVTGEYPTGDHAHGMAIGDANGDGHQDVVAANGGGTVSTLLGRGDGTFQPKRDATTSAPHTVSLGDLDGDGRLDAVVVNFDNGSVTILRGNGDGTFAALEEIPTGEDAHGAAIGDVDQDGIPDVIVANQKANTLSFLMGRGGAAFAPKVDFAVGAGAHAVAIGDLNGDGAPDVAASSIVSNTVTILLNRRPPPRAGRAFAAESDEPLLIRSAKPTVTLYVEPVGDAFRADQIDLATGALVSHGTGSVARIAAVSSKGATVGDRDRNGVPDVALTFRREDVRALFSGIVGCRSVDVAVEGRLTDGAHFSAPLRLAVIGSGPARRPVAVHPNPLNPAGTVSFALERPAPVTVLVFDARGALVRTLLDRQPMEAGEVRIALPGEDGRGRPLASGVYFVRVGAAGSAARTGRFVIVR